jgi:hypothetical protein
MGTTVAFRIVVIKIVTFGGRKVRHHRQVGGDRPGVSGALAGLADNLGAVGHVLRRLGTAFGGLGQHRVHEVGHRAGHVGRERRHRVVLVHDRDRERLVRHERRLAGQALVGDDAERVHVG